MITGELAPARHIPSAATFAGNLEHVPPELNSGRIPRAFWMADFIGIDLLLGEGTMPAAYSADIRGRVIASVESGSSRREAAEEFDVSASSAING